MQTRNLICVLQVYSLNQFSSLIYKNKIHLFTLSPIIFKGTVSVSFFLVLVLVFYSKKNLYHP